MDDIVPIPDHLENPPGAAATDSENLIAHFDLDSQSAPDCAGFRGVRVFRDFFTPAESDEILREIEQEDFVKAQSGKQKQHYGPKINFNKKKMNAKHFQGIPAYASRIEDRLRQLAAADSPRDPIDRTEFSAALDAFETTDVFVLQYHERDESNLDFHLDDTFAYGELILDLSLESDSVLTFLRNRPGAGPKVTECVRVALPARSLAAVYGQARFDWEHAILSYDIKGRRTSVTLRTLHEILLRTEDGQHVIELVRHSRIPL